VAALEITSEKHGVTAPRGRIDNLIVKVAERCNLNCSYCYIYNHEDKTYLRRPKFMEEPVFGSLLARIKEYCDRRAPHAMTLTLHGGEPTLLGKRRMAAYARRAREVLADRLGAICMQTNGTLLDEEWIQVIIENRIMVGISIDGPPAVHDAYRIDHLGRGSHAATVRGLQLLQRVGLRPGVISVINPQTDGGDTYRYFRSLGVSRIEFLFPDVSRDNKERLYGESGTPIADFLISAFDAWFTEDNPDIVVRVLWGFLSSLMGFTHHSDAFGNPLMSYLIIETDGSIQTLDALRVCKEGIAESGLNVADHGFDDLARGLPLVHQVIHEGVPLCSACLACEECGVCGGGYLPHRYSYKNGFDNPSAWCEDILKLIAHLRARTGLYHLATVV
jgi:uncharacterized protein